jgi:FkbM family methyltransferase
MLMAFSHNLPRLVAQMPYYDTALPAFTKFLFRKLGRPLLVADVGANIGDTVKFVSSAVGDNNVRWVCVEADDSYLELFKANTQGIEVELHAAIAGATSGTIESSIVSTGAGSSLLVTGGSRRPSICLDEILRGRRPDVIKTDTDGHEVSVLKGALSTLEKAAPHLFVEFSPRHLRKYGHVEPSDLFTLLEKVGYTACLTYDNHGYPAAIVGLNTDALRFLVKYCDLNTSMYMDLLISKDATMLAKFYEHDLIRFVK